MTGDLRRRMGGSQMLGGNSQEYAVDSEMRPTLEGFKDIVSAKAGK